MLALLACYTGKPFSLFSFQCGVYIGAGGASLDCFPGISESYAKPEYHIHKTHDDQTQVS